MKRLIVSGLPCPAEPWLDFLGGNGQTKVVTIREVFEHSNSSDPREMSRYVTRQIQRFQPDSIIAHDIGVPFVLLSLLRLNRKNLFTETPVTLFNGAFRRVNLFKANHPFRFQLMRSKRAIEIGRTNGAQFDETLRPYTGRIRELYRYIILYGLSERIGSVIGLDELVGFTERSSLKSPIQIIASPNDPFIPIDSVAQLRHDIPVKRYIEVEYGHFPYNGNQAYLNELIDTFETNSPHQLKPATDILPQGVAVSRMLL